LAILEDFQGAAQGVVRALIRHAWVKPVGQRWPTGARAASQKSQGGEADERRQT
jgi:hypothetical protein